MKETDESTVVVSERKRKTYVVAPLVGVYLLSMAFNLSQLGEPLAFMGAEYSAEASESIIFVNSIISLYLIVGILKRQQITLWLLMVFNFLHSLNGLSNLLMLPVKHIPAVSGGMAAVYEYRLNSFWVFFLFLLLNVILYFNRQQFDNKSFYLW
ncbi:hypothetical protein [Geomesophilobacter sediminis]|uniref:Uncharacterized protein n=1 Tax=Geomesophilobacter sediminis TaxID=2798584 RepID=A0A8J7M2K3_9BACT|nr:hypothetical protein [Geomesophilobacter sediminis]MBJ6727359.1 hypothetical protein [Geomesophilobacter sediminis]